MNRLNELTDELNRLADPKQSAVLQRFFKTGPGQYGHGDIFLGIKVPVQRNFAKNYYDLEFSDLQKLLNSKIHEYRLTALIILSEQYKKAGEKKRNKIYKFYLKNFNHINNWDLVDVTCPGIVGDYLLNRDRNILYKFARSKNLWKKRIAIISTLTFIRHHQFNDTIKISEILIKDQHDLIHKATGWMLREAGKRDRKVLKIFLDKYAAVMPRTMLRYAIEKLPAGKRRYYLKLAAK